MGRLLCWFFGHEMMMTSARQRVCNRCDQRETLRQIGRIIAWEEVAKS